MQEIQLQQVRFLKMSVTYIQYFVLSRNVGFGSFFAYSSISWKRYEIYCYALKMITVVIETFARCQLYRLLWP